MKPASLILLFGLFTGCTQQQTMPIPDVTQPATLSLSPPPGKTGRGVSLTIRGSIDGPARIWYGNAPTNLVQGSIVMRFNDNFSTNFVVHYLPEGVHAGKLTIRYSFD